MKKLNIFYLLTVLLPLLGILGSCSNEDDIVFDREKPAFEIKADRILLETLLPSKTKSDEDVYIVGQFNGLNDSTVIGHDEWKLNLKDTVFGKRGIYLDPTTFVNGKTLADGYHFVSSTQRNEVTALGDTVTRTQSPSLGTSTTFIISKWAAYFDPEPVNPTITHDGYVVYVDDQSGWDGLALYMWGDTNDLNGGWPGMKPTGTQTINGTTYKYFDMGEANTGLKENLIFNNNGGGSQLSDFAYTIDHDEYLRITSTGVEEIGEPSKVTHDGFTVYVDNKTSWGDALSLYMWGDTNDLNGGWPGMNPTGTETLNGIKWTYFDMGDANTGLNENLIFNNNGGGSQLSDFAFTLNRNIYLRITDSGVTEVDAEGNEISK